MKKLILSASIALFSIGLFAQTSTENLPSTVQEFIKINFSSATVEKVKENSNWDVWEDEKYEVRLSNGVELDFDKNGEVIEIDSKNDEAIPHTALPSNIASYLQENYPKEKVVGWDNQKKEQEVELANGTELEFDGQGNFRKLD